jgi:hypothetical protein
MLRGSIFVKPRDKQCFNAAILASIEAKIGQKRLKKGGNSRFEFTE